jgi:hypothetical protein
VAVVVELAATVQTVALVSSSLDTQCQQLQLQLQQLD